MSGTKLVHKEISSPRVSKFNVYVEGDLKHSHFVVLTVHDLGCNQIRKIADNIPTLICSPETVLTKDKSWFHFLEHYSFEEIRKRASFIHVDVPGQEDEARDLPAESPPKKKSGMNICYTFPSMQCLGEDLVCVLDQLGVKQVIGLGEGAGANILARFAMSHPNRVMGICLIHCTGTVAGFMESLKDKMIGWKLNHIGMNPTAEAYLVLHRFGSFEKAKDQEELTKVLQTFQETLRSKINPHNLNRFVQSFMKRTNIADTIGKVSCPVLMVTGSKASFNHTVHHLYGHMSQRMNKSKVELLEVEGVANVLEERPEKMAESFLYFCQGIGVVGGVPMPRVQRTASIDSDGAPKKGLRMRSMSMEEADQPTGLYSTSPTRFGSPPKCGTSPVKGGEHLSSSPK